MVDVRHLLVGLSLILVTAFAQADSAREVAWTRAALSRLPVGKHDRTPERIAQHARNLDVFAVEMARVAEKEPLPAKQWISLLGAIGSVESNFDTEVTAGRCERWQCDAHLVKGVVVHRAKGSFQQQLTTVVADLWPTADDNIPAQVEMADRTLRRSLGRCKGFAAFPAHVFRAYGGGR